MVLGMSIISLYQSFTIITFIMYGGVSCYTIYLIYFIIKVIIMGK